MAETGGRSSEEFADFLVADLTEVPKGLPDGEKRGGHRRAYDVVDDACELPAGRFRSRRHRDHDFGWVGLPQRLYGREHAGPGRESVVDQDHRLAGQVEGRATATVGRLAPEQLAPFTFGDIAQLLWGDSQCAKYIVVDNHASVTCQCTHRELFVSGRTELAHDERVQRSAEGRGHLPCDGYSAAGQTQNYDVLTSPVCTQQIGQYAACLTSVTEDAPWRAFGQASRTSHSGTPSN